MDKTIEDFVEEHRQELNSAINSVIFRHDGNGGRGTVPTPPPVYDDEELQDWIINDESLYNWARSEGVDV